MAIAEIRSLRNGVDPEDGVSRDDLVIGDVVEVQSINTGIQYAWSIAFKPEGSTAVFSTTGTEQAVSQNPGTFTVDVDGPYLIRLAFMDATGTTEQFVRLRALTAFGDLKLVAAGERYDTMSVPVDLAFDGWADEQNFNLNTLLSLVKTTTTSGRVVYVDPDAGDYTTIQAAIGYAVSQGPTSAQQWVVLVRPGTYTEDLTFAPYVHVFGWPGGRETEIVKVRNATNAGHTINLPGAGENVALADISFQQPITSPNAAFIQTGAGAVRVFRCTLEAQGNTGEVWSTQGPTYFTECIVNGNGVNPTDYALRTTSLLVLNHSFVNGMSCVLADTGTVYAKDTRFTPTGTYAINTNASLVRLQWCRVSGLIAANPSGAGAGGDLTVEAEWSTLQDITIDGNAVGGTAQILLGSASHGTVTPINGATVAATVPSDTNFYDNTTTGLTAENVQAALDEIYAYAEAVRTLDDAYDGGLPGSGSGRTIVADAGAVQITDGPAPSDPPPPSNTNGNLNVVGAVNLGAIDKPEINLNPNPFDNGPMVLLGHEVWANDAPYGGTAWIMGNATGLPQDHNYNLVLGTMSAQQGTTTGRVILMGGDAVSAVDAATVFIQGGTAQNGGGGAAGDIYLAPGQSAAGAAGQVILVDQSTGTGATLTAAGAFVNPMVASTVTFGTNEGAIQVTFAGGENLAAVQALFDATGVVTAAGDPIVLTTAAKGPTAEIYFLGESVAGADTALGGFNGQAMVPGTWPSAMGIALTGPDEITFGVGDPNPMIYDSGTGKLTVPGLIDPTGMIFDEAVKPPTGANKGAFFVSNTTGGGLTRNKPYYVDENGVTTELGGGGGGGGDVVGPGAATDEALVRFDGATGKLVQNSNALLDDIGNLTLAADLSVIKTVTGSPAGDAFVRLGRVDDTSDCSILFQSGGGTQWVTGLRASSDDYTISSNSGSNQRLKVDTTGVVTFNDAFSFPSADGGANQVLQTDGAGSITWAAVGTGDVTGPGASTDNALVRFNLATGKVLQNSNAILEDSGDLTLAGSLTVDPPIAGNDAYGIFDRVDNTSSSAIIHMTGAAPDWITGTTVGNSNYTIADGGGTERLRVTPTGDVRINNAFTLPSTDGIANQVLQTDGAGGVTWASPSSSGWPTSTGTDALGIDYEMAELTVGNAYIVLQPGAAGPIQTSVSDGAIAGGSNRAPYATDWQRFRTAATQVASGSYSVIGGGRQNEASGTDATVSGGQANQANGDQSTVSGGQLNDADAIHSTITGGLQNEILAAATYATIPGGRENALLGQGSVAMGVRSRTYRTAQMVHASGSFAGAAPFGDAQHGRMVLRTTTNNNLVEMNSSLGLGGVITASDFLTLENNSGHFFTLHVIARAAATSPSPQEDAWWSVEGCIIKENNNASTVLIGPALPTAPDGTRGLNSVNWRLDVAADTTNGRLRIAGDSAGFVGDVRWVATLQTTQVGL
ncbi:MAG: hypothetical protein CMJ67_10570 [Planctomycetaceae bacterium]|nr:hypothetical protein [Planctomycetaceae bacterium]